MTTEKLRIAQTINDEMIQLKQALEEMEKGLFDSKLNSSYARPVIITALKERLHIVNQQFESL